MRLRPLLSRPLLLALTLSCVVACDALPSGHDTTNAKPTYAVIGGSPSVERPEIALLQYGGSACTATLIRPNIAITAAHCVDWSSCSSASCVPRPAHLTIESSGRSRSYPLAAYTSFNQRGPIPAGFRNSHSRTMDSQYGSYKRNDDVALVLLAEAVHQDVARPSTLNSIYPARGAGLTLWGYGCTNTRTQQGAGTKRHFDRVEGQGTSKNLCPGDSGGPVTLGRNGPVVYVNSGYLSRMNGKVNDMDIFGDPIELRRHIDAQIQAWASFESAPPSAMRPKPEPPGRIPPKLIPPEPVLPRPIAPRPKPEPWPPGLRRDDPDDDPGGWGDEDGWDQGDVIADPEGFERRLREHIDRQIEGSGSQVTINGGSSSSVVTINGRRVTVEGSNVDVSVVNGDLTVNGKRVEMSRSGGTIELDGATIRIDPE